MLTQTVTTNEDTHVAITLTGGDGDDGGDQRLTFVVASLPAYGMLSVGAGGVAIVAADLPKSLPGNTVVFRPTTNGTLPSNFRFWVKDDGGTTDGGVDTSADGHVTVDITPLNDLPTIDELAEALIEEDAFAQTMNLTGITAGGGESQTLSVTATTGNPGLIPQPTIDYSSPDVTGTLQFAPVADQNGTAVVTVVVKDVGLDGVLGNADDGSFARSFTITVTAMNDAPTLAHPGNQTLDEKMAVTFTLTATDVDVVAGVPDTVRYSIVSGGLTGMTLDGSTGAFGWTPTEAQDGQHVVVFRAQDNHDLASTDQTITITVNEVNDAPVLTHPGDMIVTELQQLAFTLSATDNLWVLGDAHPELHGRGHGLLRPRDLSRRRRGPQRQHQHPAELSLQNWHADWVHRAQR